MSEYYYLLTSLPSLSFDQKAPLDMKGLLALCKGNISQRDYDNLKAFTISGGHGCRLAERWTEFHRQFQARLTAERQRKHGEPVASAVVSALEDNRAIYACISQAMSLSASEGGKGNPLEAEIFMLEFLYRQADEMIGLSCFDTDALFGYAAKLLILNRKDVFSALEGRAEYQRLFSGLQGVMFDTNTELE